MIAAAASGGRRRHHPGHTSSSQPCHVPEGHTVSWKAVILDTHGPPLRVGPWHHKCPSSVAEWGAASAFVECFQQAEVGVVSSYADGAGFDSGLDGAAGLVRVGAVVEVAVGGGGLELGEVPGQLVGV